MWEPFTDAARSSIVLAQEAAQRRGAGYIATEHLLLGILSSTCVAAQVLAKLGVDRDKLEGVIDSIVGSSKPVLQEGQVFTPLAKRVIELAFEEARALQHNYIGTEHLLLGLAENKQGVAARALAILGVEAYQVRWELVIAPALDDVLKGS